MLAKFFKRFARTADDLSISVEIAKLNRSDSCFELKAIFLEAAKEATVLGVKLAAEKFSLWLMQTYFFSWPVLFNVLLCGG